jgi:gas vesicle protein
VNSEQSPSEAEPLDPGAEAELANVELNSENDRAVNVYCDSNDSGGLSANQFQDFMSTVMKEFRDLKESMRAENTKLAEEFSDLKESMRSENTKLAENIKTLGSEMTIEIEVASNSLSDRLTKQFRDKSASLKKEIADKLSSEVSNLTEAINQLRKDTDSEVLCLNHSIDIMREQLNDSMIQKVEITQNHSFWDSCISSNIFEVLMLLHK